MICWLSAVFSVEVLCRLSRHVDKGSLGADSDAVLLFLGLLVFQHGGGIASVGRDCRPGPSRRR